MNSISSSYKKIHENDLQSENYNLLMTISVRDIFRLLNSFCHILYVSVQPFFSATLPLFPLVPRLRSLSPFAGCLIALQKKVQPTIERRGRRKKGENADWRSLRMPKCAETPKSSSARHNFLISNSRRLTKKDTMFGLHSVIHNEKLKLNKLAD